MSQLYTGTNSGKAGLEMTEVDGVPDVNGVSKITVSNGTLTDDGNGDVTLTTGGGGGGGVTTLAFGTTGLTPAAATSGVIAVAGTLVVANGGTGATTLTDGGPLLGSGTGAITALAQPTNGQLIIGSTGADPALGTLASSGGSVTITNSAGGINLEATNSVATGVVNEVAFYTATDAIGGDTGFTYVPTGGSRKLTVADSNAGTLFQLESTDAGAGTAPDMVMLRNSATPAPGDDLGVIVFKGNDDGGAEGEYARISAEANAVTAGSESGQLDFRVFAAGSIGNQLRITETGVTVNIANDSVTDFIVETATVTNAFKVDAGADTASVGVPLTTQAIEIDGALNHDGTTVGFYGATPVVQGTASAWPAPAPLPPVADPAFGPDVDTALAGIAGSLGSIVTLLTDLGLSA